MDGCISTLWATHTVYALLSLKKKGNSDIYYNAMNPDNIGLSQINQSQNDKYGVTALTHRT